MSKFLQAQMDKSSSSSSNSDDNSSSSSSDNEEIVQKNKKTQQKPVKKSKFQVQEDQSSDSEPEKVQQQQKKKSKFQVAENQDSESDSEQEKKQKKQEAEQQKPQKKILTKEEKKKLKQQKQQQEDEEDIDAILNAAIEEKKKQEAAQEKKNQEIKENEENNEDQENADENKSTQKSKAQLKREKKKQKEKEQKQGGNEQTQETQETQENQESKASKNKKKKGGAAKPTSKIAEMILQQQKQKEEDERIYQEALKKAQEEEEARIAAEKAAEEEKQRLKKEEKERKKKTGELLSKGEQKKKEKLEKARQQLLRQQELQQKLAEQQLQKQADKEQKQQEQEQKEIEKKEQEKQEKLLQQQQNLNNKEKKQSEDSALDNWEDFEEVEEQQKKKQEELEKLKQQQQEEEMEMKRKNSSGKKKKKKSWEYLEGVNNNSVYQSKPSEKGVLRSPIIVIMGHVDTGKTTLLDKLRHTNVQGGEAGGITQQIGATFFPSDKVTEQIVKIKKLYDTELKAPGFLVIDTPGHESFANLRSRGSSLCDFAILVIDLMHGLEQQTMESIKLLTMRKTPFVIALNKIDRCYDWKAKPYEPSQIQLKNQKKNTQEDFETRYQRVVTQLAQIEKNAILYWQNEDIKSFFPIVPTSGVTGEGIPDLLAVITKYTSQFMKNKMIVKEDTFNCTVMEVKVIEGHGTTIDCILIDGVIRKGDTITILGFNGPITTKIRALLTPHPMKEMRVKGEYIQHDVIYAAMGIKIAAKGIDEAVAGCQLIVSKTPEEIAIAENTVSKELEAVKKKIQLQDQGVGVAASTLGSLEALLSFLKESNIPVSYVTIGPVSKDDINRAMKSLLADDVESRKKEFAVMLVFDIKVLKEAAAYAEEQGVKIFTAQIIYHLQDQYMEYHRKCVEEKRQQHIKDAVFPCEVSIVKIFRMNKPLILGVKVEFGQLRVGTPLVADIDGKPVKIGVVDSMESNGKPVKNGVIKPENGETAVKILESDKVKGGQTFTENHKLFSQISRHSIDCLKEYFREDVSKAEWKFILKTLKPYFNVY